MEYHYCWRCRCEVPLLDEQQWQSLSASVGMAAEIKQYRASTGASVKDAQLAVEARLLDEFNRLTGFNETNVLAIFHHRRSLFGGPCRQCGHLLRTPRASYCANCGEVK